MNNKTIWSVIPWGIILLSGAGVSAIAQEPRESQVRVIEEVVVTARRREESQQSVPLSISALSDQALERAGITTLIDLPGSTPSLHMVPTSGSRTNPTVALRGQKQGDTLLTVDPAVSIYLAEIPITRANGIGRLGVLDVRSVEVVKGPQGTLFGRNTTGGAILISPNQPSHEFEASVKAGVGSDDRRMLEGMLNVPVSESVAGRVAVAYHKRDGLLESRGSNGPWYQEDDISWRASLKFQPTDRLSSIFYTDGFNSDTNGQAVTLAAVNPNGPLAGLLTPAFNEQQNSDFYSSRSNVNSFEKIEVLGISNTTVYELTESLALKNIIGYRKVDSDNQFDLDGSALPLLRPRLFPTVDQWSEELQLSYEDAGPLSWVAGVFYYRENGEDRTLTLFPFATTPQPQFNEITNTSYSVYGQGTYDLTSALSFTLGLRYTRDKREFTHERGPSTPPSIGDSETFNEPTWNIGLDYQISDDHLVYIAHRHGYRSGGFNGRAVIPGQLEPFDPEEVDDIEIGSKSDLLIGDSPLRLNAALFYSDYQDIQRTVATVVGGTLTTTVENAASATVYGGEIEATWLVTPSLEINGFVAMSKARYDDWDVPVFDGSGNQVGVRDESDNRFAGIPDYSANLSIRYRLLSHPGIGDVFLQGGAFWQDDTEYFDINGPGTEQEAYTLYNARVDWERVLGNDRLTISAWGRNLDDEEYKIGALNIFNSLGYTANYVGDPRTFGVDLSYRIAP